jgi:hypothetical protein
MAFLFRDQNQGTRNEKARTPKGTGIATVLFHPDFNRRLRSCTESADPSSLSFALVSYTLERKALAGLGFT